MKKLKLKILLILLISLLFSARAYGQNELAAHMIKGIIDISASYSGERLLVYGIIPHDCELIIAVTSAFDTLEFNFLGKKGPLWMNQGKVSFFNCPYMYKIKSTRPLTEILPEDTLNSYYLGFDALKSSIICNGVDNPDYYKEELFNMRIEQRLFSDYEGIIELHKGNLFDAGFYWPSRAKIGIYSVNVFAVRDSMIIGHVHEKVNVQQIGIEQWLSSHAQNHGFLYGVVAVAIAIFFGILISLITRGIFYYMSVRKSIKTMPGK